MKILIADKFSEEGIQRLRDAGHEVFYEQGLKEAALEAFLSRTKPQILVVRSTSVPAAFMDANLALELIVRAGAGYDTIDVEGASRRGIFVANCPGKNAVAVAELTLGLILAIDRRIPDNVIEIRNGRWDKALFSKADGIKGKTLGLIGLGSIGREVAARAAAFEMEVIAWSRSLTEERARDLDLGFAASPLDVARQADIVSVHVASSPETRGLISRDIFEAMKPGAVLINTSRAQIVDEEALSRALAERGLRYGTDVPHDEPQAKQGAFAYAHAQNPNVYVTHHIGASTAQAESAIGEEAVRVILEFTNSGAVPNCVNIASHTPATHLVTVRHLDKVGVLAAVLDVMRKAEWNVQDMENLIFEGATAACARIKFDGAASEEVIQQIGRHEDVLAVSILPIPNNK